MNVIDTDIMFIHINYELVMSGLNFNFKQKQNKAAVVSCQAILLEILLYYAKPNVHVSSAF